MESECSAGRDTGPSEDVAACGCCGIAFSERDVVRLSNRPDVVICHECVHWLPGRRPGLVRAVPVLHTADLRASVQFWESAGFSVACDGNFASAYQGGVELHLVAVAPRDRDRGAAYLHVRGVDDVHHAWLRAGLPVTEVRNEPWEMREFRLTDPGANLVRIGENS